MLILNAASCVRISHTRFPKRESDQSAPFSRDLLLRGRDGGNICSFLPYQIWCFKTPSPRASLHVLKIYLSKKFELTELFDFSNEQNSLSLNLKKKSLDVVPFLSALCVARRGVKNWTQQVHNSTFRIDSVRIPK